MNVASGRRKITVAGQIRQGVRIHVSCPAGQAGVSERVEGESFHIRDRARLWVLFLEGRFFKVAAPRAGHKVNPRRRSIKVMDG